MQGQTRGFRLQPEDSPNTSQGARVHLVPDGEPIGKRLTVRDENEDRSRRCVQIEQQGGDAVGRAAIEVAGWLIAQKQRGVADQRARQRRALFFSARELGGPVIEPIAEDPRWSEGHARARVVRAGLVPAGRSHESRGEHVLEDRALRQQRVVLEYEPDVLVPKRCLRSLAKRVRILAIQRQTSRRGRFERAEHVEQRALSASRRSHDRNRIAALERQ